jgi:hypothetical protein
MAFSEEYLHTSEISIQTDFFIPLSRPAEFYRYNLHPRQSLRANILYGGLRGNDLDFNNSFQQSRAESFSATVGEVVLQFEFNFLPYTTLGKTWDFTPYIAAGPVCSIY